MIEKDLGILSKVCQDQIGSSVRLSTSRQKMKTPNLHTEAKSELTKPVSRHSVCVILVKFNYYYLNSEMIQFLKVILCSKDTKLIMPNEVLC